MMLNSEPAVQLCQRLIVPLDFPTIGSMENQERLDFSKRLNEACDDMGLPPKYKARQVELARLFDVSPRGAAKWLEGESYPAVNKCSEIAKWSGVCFEWLMTGRGPKRFDEIYPTRAIAHVAEVMQAMAPAAQSKAAQMVDLLAQPAAGNDAGADMHDKSRAAGGQ